VTSAFCGSEHEVCNFIYQLTGKILVIFHNLRGYDSHFIMEEIGKFKNSLGVIPNNMEKYMVFFLGYQLKFIDSFQFMSKSLESFVENISFSDMKYTSQE